MNAQITVVAAYIRNAVTVCDKMAACKKSVR